MLDRYRIIRQAEWSNHTVYTAEDSEHGQVVYLVQTVGSTPVLPPHPALPQPVSVISDQQGRWSVIPCPEGESLSQLIAAGSITWADLELALFQTLGALTDLAAHNPWGVPPVLDPDHLRRTPDGQWILDIFARPIDPVDGNGEATAIAAFGKLLHYLLHEGGASVPGKPFRFQVVQFRYRNNSYTTLDDLWRDLRKTAPAFEKPQGQGLKRCSVGLRVFVVLCAASLAIGALEASGNPLLDKIHLALSNPAGDSTTPEPESPPAVEPPPVIESDEESEPPAPEPSQTEEKPQPAVRPVVVALEPPSNPEPVLPGPYCEGELLPGASTRYVRVDGVYKCTANVVDGHISMKLVEQLADPSKAALYDGDYLDAYGQLWIAARPSTLSKFGLEFLGMNETLLSMNQY